MTRRAAKIDTNQSEIVKALRGIPGVMVEVGHDDIFVGYRGLNYWFEVKNPNEVDKHGIPYKEKANNKTAQKQKWLRENWQGQYHIVSTLNQILEIMNVSQN